jgi:hypothetical protein
MVKMINTILLVAISAAMLNGNSNDEYEARLHHAQEMADEFVYTTIKSKVENPTGEEVPYSPAVMDWISESNGRIAALNSLAIMSPDNIQKVERLLAEIQFYDIDRIEDAHRRMPAQAIFSAETDIQATEQNRNLADKIHKTISEEIIKIKKTINFNIRNLLKLRIELREKEDFAVKAPTFQSADVDTVQSWADQWARERLEAAMANRDPRYSGGVQQWYGRCEQLLKASQRSGSLTSKDNKRRELIHTCGKPMQQAMVNLKQEIAKSNLPTEKRLRAEFWINMIQRIKKDIQMQDPYSLSGGESLKGQGF